MRSSLFVRRLLRVSQRSPLSRRWPVLSAVLRLEVGVAVNRRAGGGGGVSDEAAEMSLKNGRGGSEKKEGLENFSREGGAAGEAGKSMCRASLEGHVLQLQVYLGSRQVGTVGWQRSVCASARVCRVGLGWVGLCFADRIRQDGVRNAKYSLGMGAGAADGRPGGPDDEATMSPVCTEIGWDRLTGYDRARQNQSRAAEKGAARSVGRTCMQNRKRERRAREIGAQFCAWEAIPGQASETVRLLRPR